MRVKKYDDNTFNIHYEVGDLVKVQNNPKFGTANKDDGKWGKITKIMGKPLTAKVFIETDKDKVESFVWNIKPCKDMGVLLTKEEIFKNSKVVEMIQIKLETINENKKIVKFTDI